MECLDKRGKIDYIRMQDSKMKWIEARSPSVRRGDDSASAAQERGLRRSACGRLGGRHWAAAEDAADCHISEALSSSSCIGRIFLHVAMGVLLRQDAHGF